ncbi:hypothetical protein [Streptomyces sp. NPDC054849]
MAVGRWGIGTLDAACTDSTAWAPVAANTPARVPAGTARPQFANSAGRPAEAVRGLAAAAG